MRTMVSGCGASPGPRAAPSLARPASRGRGGRRQFRSRCFPGPDGLFRNARAGDLLRPAIPGPASPSSTAFTSPSSLPSGGDAGTAPGSPDASGGALGGFGSVTEACAAVSATVLSVLALPMAAATGQDTAEAEKARTELEKLQAKVPAEIKESIDKLKAVADDAGKDLSTFNSEEFDKAIAPIDAWLQSHC